MKKIFKFIPAIISLIVIIGSILWISEYISDSNRELYYLERDTSKFKERIKFWESECDDASERFVQNAILREQAMEYELYGQYMSYRYDEYDRRMVEDSYYKIYKKNGSYYCDYYGRIEETLNYISRGGTGVRMNSLEEYKLTKTSYKGYNYYFVNSYGDREYIKIW